MKLEVVSSRALRSVAVVFQKLHVQQALRIDSLNMIDPNLIALYPWP